MGNPEENSVKIVSVYSTTSNIEEAKNIGRTLLEKKLVACVNIIPEIKSMYWWEGKIETDNECIMLAKTPKKNVEEVICTIKKLHSYDIPCIVALPIINGLEDYLDYVINETK